MAKHSPARILLIDDEAALRQSCSEALAGFGYEVHTAPDGLAGWNVLLAARHARAGYDLLITDNDMPKLSGVELIQKLRAEQIAVPVIMATGTSPQIDATLQVAVVLEKPFTLDQFIKTVKKVLQTASPEATMKVNPRLI